MADVELHWDNERWEWVVGPVAGAGECVVSENPPSTIRGVQNTDLKTGVLLRRGLVLDWLAVTFPTETVERRERVLLMLGATFPDLTQTPYGGRGYTAGATFLGNGRVLWNVDRLEMGVHLQLSATTLQKAVELIPDFDPVEYMRVCIETWGAKPTRLDLALDTEQDIVTKALGHFERGDVSTRAKGFDPRCPQKFTTDRENPTEMSGRGVYLGSRRSDTFVRFYDKALEQGVDVSWFRAEYVFGGKNAVAVGDLVLAGNFDAILGAFLSHLDFKKRSAVDSNKARWGTSKWWHCLLKDAVKHKLMVGVSVRPTIEQIGQWLDRQVGPTLALWWVHCEKKGVDLDEWVMDFAARWGPRHKLILQTV